MYILFHMGVLIFQPRQERLTSPPAICLFIPCFNDSFERERKMLGNCDEKMVVISSTNEWPQNHIDDQKALMAETAARTMEKPGQEQLQQQQQALKCPRCDSSNTKFCYYNNYSLSQPRHFCKACKRYWTRGGTLRNVPVGGGCRKNKRVKRPASAIDGVSSSSSSSAPSSNLNQTSQPQIDLSATSNHISHLFYGLNNNPSDMSLPFPRFNTSGVSNVDTVSGYDLQPQLNSLGLGFSSGIISNGVGGDSDYRNGFNPTKQIQDIVTSTSLLSSYSIFSSPSCTTASPTMASLLASKFTNIGGLKDARGEPNHFQSLAPLEDLDVAGNGEVGGMGMKGVKLEEEQSRLVWNNAANCQNQTGQIGLSDPSLYWNASSAIGTNWHDPANIGSSVTSLI
ncbi:dof zinc finger protein DOF1.4 [Ziziphus jujuba]|uniref:Dof zinc finger protein n=2 Tax=Ziziphus jujuba TaxID=326968 RepID=A0A6P4A609_ZIZJJ|nr:dof zinc finger protein DOF1.4 [Ziziphus jujuba]KAH7546030.1 hypothetical protein FEM48_Zijuj01G0157500 [Ziziphus jujuba var. spinosa]